MASAASPRGRRGRGGLSDREAGIVAIGLIAALGVVIASFLTVVVFDRTTWGYAVHL